LVELPQWGAVLARGDFDAVFYDCLDDFGSFAGRNSAERLDAWERRLVDLSTAAFATARALAAHLESLRPGLTVHRAPHGGAVDRFRGGGGAAAAAPRAARARPVAGYVGVIGRWLDYDVLEAAIAACREIDFVFVGPATDAGRRRLQQHANVRCVPRQPYAEV